jgi:hypothetical protein
MAHTNVSSLVRVTHGSPVRIGQRSFASWAAASLFFLGVVGVSACHESASDAPAATASQAALNRSANGAASASADEKKEAPAASPAEDDRCTSDGDCVPASCCHAKSCVAKAQKPECKGIMCSMHCEAETMDCGGGCGCQAGHCVARLVRNPAAPQ